MFFFFLCHNSAGEHNALTLSMSMTKQLKGFRALYDPALGDIFDEFLFYFLWPSVGSRAIVYIKLGFPRDPELSEAPTGRKLGFSGSRLIEAKLRRWDESLSVIEDLKFPVGWSHRSLGLFYENFNILEPGGGNWGFQKLGWADKCAIITSCDSSEQSYLSTFIILAAQSRGSFQSHCLRLNTVFKVRNWKSKNFN